MVFCYQTYSDLCTVRKNCSSEWEKLLKLRLKAENLQKIWDHYNNLFKQWKFSTIFGNRMLFLACSWIRTIRIKIGKYYWDLETYSKS